MVKLIIYLLFIDLERATFDDFLTSSVGFVSIANLLLLVLRISGGPANGLAGALKLNGYNSIK